MQAVDRCRFETFVTKNTGTDCWDWLGYKGKDGYGQFKLYGKVALAHRIAFEIYKGEIPAGQQVNHSCGNSGCTNPMHLWLGTHKEKMEELAEENKTRGIELGKKYGPIYGPINAKKQRKFTDDEIRQIRSSSQSLRVLAAKYGTSSSVISNIVNFKTYADI